MALSTYGNSGEKLGEEWHKLRLKARRSLNIDQWSEIDIERGDLDNIDFDRSMRPIRDYPETESEGSVKSYRPREENESRE